MAEASVPPKRKKTLIIVIAAVAVLVAVAAIAAFLLIRSSQLAAFEGGFSSGDDTAGEAHPPASHAPAAGQSSGHVFSTLEMFTANLADRDQDRFAQVAVVIEVTDGRTEAALKAIIPIVRSEILLLLTSKSAAELLSLEGKQKLAREILELARKNIAADYRNDVHAAHFSSFVIQ